MSKSSLVKITSELLHEDKVLKIRAVGCSMLPLFKENDQFIIQKCVHSKISIGDIVIFERENILTAHRITHITKEHIITWGDFNLKPDAPIKIDQIIAKVISAERNGKSLRLSKLRYRIWSFLMTHNAPFNHKLINLAIRIYLKCKRLVQIK